MAFTEYQLAPPGCPARRAVFPALMEYAEEDFVQRIAPLDASWLASPRPPAYITFSLFELGPIGPRLMAGYETETQEVLST